VGKNMHINNRPDLPQHFNSAKFFQAFCRIWLKKPLQTLTINNSVVPNNFNKRGVNSAPFLIFLQQQQQLKNIIFLKIYIIRSFMNYFSRPVLLGLSMVTRLLSPLKTWQSSNTAEQY
jgi:hypothetical protein